MPQYKKDLIKQQIKDSAMGLFSTIGYQQTTIANISNVSNVSVGNIYRYFPAKADILDELINYEFFEMLKKLIGEKIRDNPLSNDLMDFILKNKELFLLAFNGLKGTKYEAFVDEIIDYMTNLVMEMIVMEMISDDKRDQFKPQPAQRHGACGALAGRGRTAAHRRTGAGRAGQGGGIRGGDQAEGQERAARGRLLEGAAGAAAPAGPACAPRGDGGRSRQ
jgi:AcrR family transcriptional regulator